MFKVKVIRSFKDLATPNNLLRRPGDIINVDTEERLLTLMGDNSLKLQYVQLMESTLPKSRKRTGPKIIIHQEYLYHIGGIETFLFNFLKHYKDRNITLVVTSAEIEPLLRFAPYCNIVVDQLGKRYKCDVCILGSWNSQGFINKCSAKKIYQMIHADWSDIIKYSEWTNLTYRKHSKVDNIICVSETAQKGLKKVFNYDSEVIYNILEDDIDDSGTMMFITLSRATVEKGIDRIIDMAYKFKKAGKSFVWFLGCSLEQATPEVRRTLTSMPEFIILPPKADNKKLISHCDYLVQLSDTESFCYSAFEALQRGVPVILTRFPEAYNIVEQGKNGYLVEMDLSDLDIDKIFNHKPKKVDYIDRCDYDQWEKVFKGEL